MWDIKLKHQYDYDLLDALLSDLIELNSAISEDKQIYIDYQDWHDEYSPERTDPCPDNYGLFRLKFYDNDNTIGDIMNIHELDNAICVLCNFNNI